MYTTMLECKTRQEQVKRYKSVTTRNTEQFDCRSKRDDGVRRSCVRVGIRYMPIQMHRETTALQE